MVIFLLGTISDRLHDIRNSSWSTIKYDAMTALKIKECLINTK